MKFLTARIRALCALLALASTAHPAELKPQTVQAWQDYVQSAIARMQEHLRPGARFLDIDADQDTSRAVQDGAILVSPGNSHGVKKVPSGLIHDWLGTAFIAHAKLEDILPVVRDYDRYKEFYRPSVIDSRTLAKDDREDRFSMVLMNKSLFLKTALDSDFKCYSVRVSERRLYTVSESTRIQEIENYGTPGQRALHENEGNGLIWRVMSITRFEERDGGVYIELEAIALSRDIPVSLRWFVDPIVRRISRNSLETSLRETESAVNSSVALTASSGRSGSCAPRNGHQAACALGSARNAGAQQSFR